ncbi:MAG TPA: aminotransferase class I/II-fold pyridoxal phosphate-dependent enzyme [Gaiellaceae bacterium]|jgi:histidinol-phosphate aminotransferase|nr:aminotransferase class I/II-fold pyridoxal phosphate-dependent enzyme [Gaiellaceae bacterium]
MRPLSPQFTPYGWALSTAEIAALAGIRPEEVIRFDGNTPPDAPPTASPATIADALERINAYRHGGFPELLEAIAAYNGVAPEQVVLGAGADDLLMLCARAYAGPGDRVAIAYEPSYPLYRVAAWVAGADVGDEDPVLTFVCRPHNPTGALVDLPSARPLVADEAYFEYAGETAVPLLDDGVIVVRTFSKAFGLASARVGYALADVATAEELNARQEPAPVSTLSAALALAGLEAGPPDVSETIAERERLAEGLRALGLEPLPSWTNFVLVPHEHAAELADGLLRAGLPVRPSPGAIRITVHRPDADDRLLDALGRLLAR